MKQNVFFIICLLTLIPMALLAEEEEIFAVILYAEGYEITLYQNDGTEEIYDIMYDDIVGEPMYEGESIETDGESYVEIQLYPSENILKLSESTALTLDSMEGSSGGSELSLVYGSVRAKVAKLLVDDAFSVTTGNTVAGVRGTDFGVDYIYDEDEDSYVTDVFCFEGEIEVSGIDESESSDKYRIGPDEQMSVRPRNGGPPAFNREPLPEMRKEFWEKRDFREAPIGPGAIENRFPGMIDKVQAQGGLRRFSEEQRKRPGFQGAMPQMPMQPGQSGNRESQNRQSGPLQNSSGPNIQPPEQPQRDSDQKDSRPRRN